jgi:hypothetical protein
MEMRVAAPTPINMPNAIRKFIKGNVNANPEIAKDL